MEYLSLVIPSLGALFTVRDCEGFFYQYERQIDEFSIAANPRSA